MPSYFYPTEPDWFPKFVEEWKGSNKPRLAFPFYAFEVHTLPENRDEVFWMYLYNSGNSTPASRPEDSRTVQYRVRVVRHENQNPPIDDPQAHLRTGSPEGARTWFVCDQVEEICRVDGTHLKDSDFKHAEGKNLLNAIFNSVAPCTRETPMFVRARYLYELQD